MSDPQIIKEGLAEIFRGIEKLKAGYGHRKFTIDGRLVGDIGEVLAELEFDITLNEKSKAGHDAYTSDGRLVEVKATFQNSLHFRSIPDYCIGLQLNKDGTYGVIYNGPGRYIEQTFPGKITDAGNQVSFPIKRLAEISARIPQNERISKREEKPV